MYKYSKYVKTEKIKNERIKKNMTIKDMSTELGLKSPVSYYNLEVGIVEPKISQMVKVSKLLGKSVAYFFNIQLQENWIKGGAKCKKEKLK